MFFPRPFAAPFSQYQDVNVGGGVQLAAPVASYGDQGRVLAAAEAVASPGGRERLVDNARSLRHKLLNRLTVAKAIAKGLLRRREDGTKAPEPGCGVVQARPEIDRDCLTLCAGILNRRSAHSVPSTRTPIICGPEFNLFRIWGVSFP
jgi:hypothetical protein